METRARVVEVDADGIAIVESRRKSACEGCHKKSDGEGCAVCSLMGSDPVIRTRADNALGAKVGDTVMIASDTSRMLRYAAMVFLLPLLCGAVGYLAASLLTERPVWQAGAALCGFALAFVGLRLYSARVIAKRCDTVITAILPESVNGDTEED